MSVIPSLPMMRNIAKIGQIQVAFYTSTPESVNNGKRYQLSYSSILYLQMVSSTYQTIEEWKTTRYAIRPLQLYQTVLFFNEVLGWFRLDDIYADHNGRKVFNSKYDNLYAITKKGYFDNGALKATPALIEVANDVYEEGINLYINRETNLVRLTRSQVEELFVLLRDFHFTQETLLSIELLKASYTMGELMSHEEYQRRREAIGFQMKK